MTLAVLLCSVLLLLPPGRAAAGSATPYAGQEGRDIKALSPEEVADHLAGRGMGLAKAAELNGYPGPAHVLELAGPLGLSPEQRARTQALFERMQARAIALGRELVEAERALDRLFASRTVTVAALGPALARIGELQARLRQAHLEAHLEQTALLTAEQVAAYGRLRGYAGQPSGGGHGGPGHRRH
jgi:Spy/CpxP family protein refolding chaperone